MPRIAVIGAGGLGGPIALAAAACGAEITVCDGDTVELSNLHRQIQFGEADLGRPKATVLAERIVAGGGRALGVIERFTAATARRCVGKCEVLVDASDDPATKFAVADWARANGRGYVIAAALRYGGNVFAGTPTSACYRCLFEDAPDETPTCADAGVLGPVVGWIGGVAADRALRLRAGDHAVAGSIWTLEDLRDGRPPREVALARREGCACAT